MRARHILAAGTAAFALAGSVLGASPAFAAADTTTVTFTLTAGALAIDAPTSADLGSVGTSSSATVVAGQLGTTTVTDGRASLVAAYVVTLSSGDFVTGGGTATEKVLGNTVTAFSGAATHTNATATKVASQTTTLVPSSTPIMGLAAYSGTDTSTYNPTVSIPIPAVNAAGLYTGTITQTVTAV